MKKIWIVLASLYVSAAFSMEDTIVEAHLPENKTCWFAAWGTCLIELVKDIETGWEIELLSDTNCYKIKIERCNNIILNVQFFCWIKTNDDKHPWVLSKKNERKTTLLFLTANFGEIVECFSNFEQKKPLSQGNS